MSMQPRISLPQGLGSQSVEDNARCAYQGKAQRPSEALHQSSSCVSNLGSPVRKVGKDVTPLDLVKPWIDFLVSGVWIAEWNSRQAGSPR